MTRSERVSTDGLFTLLLWVVVAAMLGHLTVDPDLWGHLRFGLDMLRDHALPSVDPYSFTQDIPWVNHEWLSELQMAAAYRIAGGAGLVALKFLVAGVACGVLAWMVRRLPFLARGAVVVVTMWAAAPLVTMMRPQLWSFACAAIVAAILARDAPSPQLLFLPAVLLVWVNVHGGWVVGGLLVAVWAVVRVRDPAWRPWVLAIGLLTIAATLINPYGIDLWTFIARTVRIGRDARDWQPLTAAPLVDWWPWFLTAVATGLLLIHRRTPIDRLVTIVLLAALSFRVVRLIPFFVLVTTIFGSPALAEALRAHPRLAWRPEAPSRGAAALMLIPTLVVAGFFLPRESRPCLVVRGYWVPEAITARALQAAHPAGKLVTEFGWGEYAIWHFGPALRVSMDGRRETVYSDATLRQYDSLLAAEPAALSFVDAERPDYIWLSSARDRLREWLVAHGYRIDIDVPPLAWLAVRNDLPRVARSAAAVTPRCFPD